MSQKIKYPLKSLNQVQYNWCRRFLYSVIALDLGGLVDDAGFMYTVRVAYKGYQEDPEAKRKQMPWLENSRFYAKRNTGSR